MKVIRRSDNRKVDPTAKELAEAMLLVLSKLTAKLPDYRFTVVCRHKDENEWPSVHPDRNVVASTEAHRMSELEKVATLVIEFGRRAERDFVSSQQAQYVIDALDERERKRLEHTFGKF